MDTEYVESLMAGDAADLIFKSSLYNRRSREVHRGTPKDPRTLEAELRAGNPDPEGLCLALTAWSAELRILEDAKSH